MAIVTGAGAGLGREHALALAGQGASVVVNDIGTSVSGEGRSAGPADQVVQEIVAMGGRAVANTDDIADFAGAERLFRTALDSFGAVHVVVNNAGFLRDRMFASSSVDEWDAVMRVHLRGHFCLSRHAAGYFRDRAKAGEPVDGRIINTSSGAGLLGAVGQSAYSAAKAGIAALTIVQAAELGRYGVTANAIAPAARTRMTEVVFGEMMKAPESGFDKMHPGNVSPLVVWLASAESRDVTGRMFEVRGGEICVFQGWTPGPKVDKGARFDPAELGPVVRRLIEEAPKPIPPYGAS